MKKANIKYLYNGKVFQATVKNISESGVFIHSKSMLKKDAIIAIDFFFPDKYNSFVVKAKVVWTKKVKKYRDAGCEYIAMNKRTSEKIRNIIKTLKSQSNNKVDKLD